MARHPYHSLSIPHRAANTSGTMPPAPGSVMELMRTLEDLACVIPTLRAQRIRVKFTSTGLRLLPAATRNNLLFLDPPSLISPLPNPNLLLHQKKANSRHGIFHKANQGERHHQNTAFPQPARPHNKGNPRRIPRSPMLLHVRLTIRDSAR